ncbi:unnamed protein product, partial [Nesidiocoris tenuis]
MEPTSVLPGDALRLAVTLCPDATSVHLRFDCSTPHHVVGPLTNLKKLIELSAVCVTSGERTLLDFTDLVPILDKFGPESIKYLELKTITTSFSHPEQHRSGGKKWIPFFMHVPYCLIFGDLLEILRGFRLEALHGLVAGTTDSSCSYIGVM